MNHIIEALKEELSKLYTQTTVDSFIGFVKTQSDILSRLENNFDAGVSFCKEIIETSRRKYVQ